MRLARGWLAGHHLERRRAELALLTALAAFLQPAAGAGLAYVVGFSQVASALGRFQWMWLLLI